jgi:hypothetical protein
MDSTTDSLLSVVPANYEGTYLHNVSTSNLDMHIESYVKAQVLANFSIFYPTNESDTYIHVPEGFHLYLPVEEKRIEVVGFVNSVGNNFLPGSINK